MRALLRRIGAYAAGADPRAAAANTVALVIVGNQPFYPIYVYALVGSDAWPTLLTFLSTPFFAAVPAVGRRNGLAGRVLLPLTGVANTVLCAKVLGTASGVEAFLLPCLTLPAILFGAGERRVALALAALPVALFLGLHDRYGVPLHVYDAAAAASLSRLHAISVACLMVVLAVLFVRVRRRPGAA